MKRLFFSILIVVLLLSACSEKTVQEEENADNRTELIWVMPEYFSITEEQQKAFNDLLKEQGCEYKVSFVNDLGLQWSPSDDGFVTVMTAYQGRLLENKTQKVDIANTGGINTWDEPTELIRSGYFEELTPFWDKDSRLRETYAAVLWEAGSVDGANTIVPSIFFKEGQVSYIFNNKYFSKEEIQGFDGKLSSVEELLGEVSGTEDFSDLVFMLDGAGIVDISCGKESCNGYVYNSETQKFEFLIRNEKAANEYRILRGLWSKGYINYDLSLQDTSEGEVFLRSGNFKVAIVSDIERIRSAINEETMTIVSSEPILYSVTAFGNGIARTSEHKEMAFDLLTRVYTEPTLLRCLVFNERNEEIYPNELCFGSDCVHSDEEIRNKMEYYNSKVIPADAIGFHPNTFVKKQAFIDVQNLMVSNLDFWKNESFEDALAELRERLNEADIVKCEDMMTEQFHNME